MKKIFLIIIAGTLLAATSCNLFDKEDEINPDNTLAKEGNSWTASAVDMPQAEITVTKNENGIANAAVKYDGQTYEIKAKVTESQIYDFVYSDGDESKPFLLCDFDAEEGDKWEYNIGNQKVVREVTHKSTEDDTFLGAFWLMVKVTEVEETVPAGATVMGFQTGEVKKIIWRFNHKFGFVSATVIKSDDSEVNITLDDTNVAK